MADNSPSEMSCMLEVATSIQVAKSVLESLASGPLCRSQKAQKLRDPVYSICKLLLDVKDSEISPGSCVYIGMSRALYEASDLVDEAAAAAAAHVAARSPYVAASSSLVSKVRCSSSSFIFGVRMGPVINRLCQKLDQLNEATELGLGENPVNATSVTDPYPTVTTASAHDAESFVGRDADKEIIVEKLLDTSDVNQHISVVSIVGMGGVGKTTLAKGVYNDPRITTHFDLKLWVCVSQEFDIHNILKSIILSCSAASSSRLIDLGLEQVIDLVRGLIAGKIFLLVLDDVDVGNESTEMWLKLESLLTTGARGSKILVTTRSQQVATICESYYVHELKCLSEEESWSLFKDLLSGQLEPPENFISMKMEIHSKCHGLPLAVAYAARFCRMRGVEEWQNHFDKPSNQPDINSILMLSYNKLNSPLKVCFAYCSLFSEGHKISVLDLVSLWMAQDYIEFNYYYLDQEDMAQEFIMVLYERGFFQEIAKDDLGNLSTFKIHQLMHNLAKQVAERWGTMTHLSYFHKGETTCLPDNCLKDELKVLSLLFRIPEEDIDHDKDDKDENEDGAPRRITIYDIVKMSSFKSLRVLDLRAFDLQVLPDLIGNLIHLRYLDLSHNEALLKLPNSISNLYHLQTLKLDSCSELQELPTSFGKLVHLRRLELDGCDKLTFMPPGFQNLSSLRILSRFVVGRPWFQSASGFEALANLNLLQRRLMIELSENWTVAAKEAEKSNLSNKNRLMELELKWGPKTCSEITDADQHQLLLDGLKPPTGLKILKIEGYRGKYSPSWARGNALSEALPNLITVSIEDCGQCETLPPFSCLQFLKCLTLRFMDNVKFFESANNQSSTSDSPFFPSLQKLTLHGFYSLEGWWKPEARVASASFKCLQELKIWSCPKLISMPLFPKVEILDMRNANEKLLESHIAEMRGSKRYSRVASSSHSEISNLEPREHLQDLKEVQIKSCPRLESLAFVKSSIKLTKLVIERLDMLSSLTEILKQLTSLQELEVADCKDLDLSGRCQDSCNGCEKCDAPLKSLSQLNRLSLRELPRLAALPVGLKWVTALRTLCISTCNSLSSLPQWISNLTSLQHLRLEGCRALMMLPEELKELNSLVKLDIIECPYLTERCKEGGEDWHKIKQARVLCHKSWRYLLMTEEELPQKPKEKAKNVVVFHSNDPTIHVDFTVRHQ